jgi:hypothetical protein
MRYGDDFVAAQRTFIGDYGITSYREALRRWIATVAIVEVDYVGEWEYASELSARDYLNELMIRSPQSRAAVEEDVSLWDQRFKAATVEEQQPHFALEDGNPGWWQHRSPGKWKIPSKKLRLL